MKKRCRCKTNARFARYGMPGSKSVNYWMPCPIHDKQEKETRSVRKEKANGRENEGMSHITEG